MYVLEEIVHEASPGVFVRKGSGEMEREVNLRYYSGRGRRGQRGGCWCGWVRGTGGRLRGGGGR